MPFSILQLLFRESQLLFWRCLRRATPTQIGKPGYRISWGEPRSHFQDNRYKICDRAFWVLDQNLVGYG
ncbi:MAG: hypothetical protein HC773_28445 [Scytonema sp. CRU_2_7]|nr:hypothetical protein [Scytonema sp. CRU_2_7]